jgi:hypothetical protein
MVTKALSTFRMKFQIIPLQLPAGNAGPNLGTRRKTGQSSLCAACLVLRLAVLMCFLAATGCSSIYGRARKEMPPEPTAELKLRVAEAERAETLVHRAGMQLLESLQKEKSAPVQVTDFNRLEAATYDLERRVLAARDTLVGRFQAEDTMPELERLEQRARAWLGFVQKGDGADRPTKIRELEMLLK